MTTAMTTNGAPAPQAPAVTPDTMMQVLGGDLAKLSPAQRLEYYAAVVKSMGLNPLTTPFAFLSLNGKCVLYALKTCADQLRATRGVSVAITGREQIGDVYVVTARATAHDGRTDESVGAVAVGGLKGDSLANALMKAETKAKRRVTLSLCGLGMLDESETETIPGARRVPVDLATGEIAAEAIAAPPEKSPTAKPARADAAPARRVDVETGEVFDEPAPAPRPALGWTPSEGQVRRIYATAKANGIDSKDDLRAFLGRLFNGGRPLREDALTREQYDQACGVELPAYGKARAAFDGDGKTPDYLDAEAEPLDAMAQALADAERNPEGAL